MADKRIKDLTTTATTPAGDDFIAIDGESNNTRKISAESFVLQTEYIYNPFEIFPLGEFVYSLGTLGIPFGASSGPIIDLRKIGSKLISVLSFGKNSLTTVLGADQLTKIKNVGTGTAVNFTGEAFDAEGINQFFTDLPVATATATLDFRNNPGSATCDPTIATAKGYTVLV